MATAGAKVTVASKLPMHLEMQICREDQYLEETPTGSRPRKRFVKDGPVVVIIGTAYPKDPPENFRDRPTMASGCALTYGVDKEFFEKWLDQNKTSPVVVNKMIFAAEKIDTVKGKARDTKDVLSGLQALKPDDDKRLPKKVGGRVNMPGTEAAVGEG